MLLYAQLVEGGESLGAIMTALRVILEQHGIPGALYTDRAQLGGATRRPRAPRPIARKLTQVGRALARLGIEHIVSFSPQARGRSERTNRTLQGRLVNELRVAQIRTLAAANRYLRQRFMPRLQRDLWPRPGRSHLRLRARSAAWTSSRSCVTKRPARSRADNTVALDRVVFQIDKQRGRRSCAGLRVLVRRHLDGRHSIWWGPRCLGRYTATGRPLVTRAA